MSAPVHKANSEPHRDSVVRVLRAWPEYPMWWDVPSICAALLKAAHQIDLTSD